jgi:hypothetical protein
MTKNSQKRRVNDPRQRFHPLAEQIHQIKTQVMRLSSKQWR